MLLTLINAFATDDAVCSGSSSSSRSSSSSIEYL